MIINPIHNAAFDSVHWAGNSFTGSRAQGEYITITPQQRQRTSTLSADGGTGSITPMNDNRCDVVLRLDQQSPANTALTAIMNDEFVNGGITVDDMRFADSNTLHLYELRGVYITQMPVETKGTDEGGVYEWNFECLQAIPKRLDQHTFKAEITAQLSADIDLALTYRVTL